MEADSVGHDQRVLRHRKSLRLAKAEAAHRLGGDPQRAAGGLEIGAARRRLDARRSQPRRRAGRPMRPRHIDEGAILFGDEQYVFFFFFLLYSFSLRIAGGEPFWLSGDRARHGPSFVFRINYLSLISDLLFDAPERPDRNVFLRMRDCDASGLDRMLELDMASLLGDLNPTIGSQGCNNAPRIHT